MKQNVLSLLQSAIIVISPGIAMQIHGQPVGQHVISNSQRFMAAAKTGHSNLRHDYSGPNENAMTIAPPAHAASRLR